MTSAVCFDLNGTLSLDEELMYEVLAEILAERGRALPRGVYFREFVGLADEEIAASWLGSPDAEAREIAGERSRRFRALPLENRIPEAAADALRVAAARVPVAIVTSSLRAEVEPLLAVAGLTGLVAVTVAGDDVGARSRTRNRTVALSSSSASTTRSRSRTLPPVSPRRRARDFAAARSRRRSLESSWRGLTSSPTR